MRRRFGQTYILCCFRRHSTSSLFLFFFLNHDKIHTKFVFRRLTIERMKETNCNVFQNNLYTKNTNTHDICLLFGNDACFIYNFCLVCYFFFFFSYIWLLLFSFFFFFFSHSCFTDGQYIYIYIMFAVNAERRAKLYCSNAGILTLTTPSTAGCLLNT